jgi:hypothetical protein
MSFQCKTIIFSIPKRTNEMENSLQDINFTFQQQTLAQQQRKVREHLLPIIKIE